MSVLRKHLHLLVLAVLFTACSQPSPAPPAQKTETEPPNIKSVDVVHAVPEEITIPAGRSAETVVQLQIKTGYHINANPPSASYLKATELDLKPADGISVDAISYPDPLVKKFSFSETPLKVYEGDINLTLKLKADKSAKTGKHNLSAKLRVQACDDRVCYAPGTMDLTVPVNIQ
jgi:DsbC/DsbD-like thiol-disulfide interchange protein